MLSEQCLVLQTLGDFQLEILLVLVAHGTTPRENNSGLYQDRLIVKEKFFHCVFCPLYFVFLSVHSVPSPRHQIHTKALLLGRGQT